MKQNSNFESLCYWIDFPVTVSLEGEWTKQVAKTLGSDTPPTVIKCQKYAQCDTRGLGGKKDSVKISIVDFRLDGQPVSSRQSESQGPLEKVDAETSGIFDEQNEIKE